MTDKNNKHAENEHRKLADADASVKIQNIRKRLSAANDPDKILSLSAELAGIQLHFGSNMNGELASARQFAQRRWHEELVDDLQDGKVLGDIYPPMTAYDQAVFNFMNNGEKDFFQSLDPNASYELLMIDESGNIVVDAQGQIVTYMVDGKTLRQDLINIIKESLSLEEQEIIEREVRNYLEKQSRAEELAALEQSLIHIEGKKAAGLKQAEIEGKITKAQAEETIKENNEEFKTMRNNIRKVKEAHEKKEKKETKAASAKPEDKNLADIMLKEADKDIRKAEESMRQSLNEGRKIIATNAKKPTKYKRKAREKNTKNTAQAPDKTNLAKPKGTGIGI